MIEIWKDIAGYERLYQVSNFGQIRNKIRGIIRKPDVDKDGYLKIGLYKGKKQYRHTIHKIVALNFIPNPNKKSTINHINANKKDNRVENLEWATVKEQNHHAEKLGILGYIGSKNPNCKLNEDKVKEIKILLKTETIKEIAKKFNVSWGLIGFIKQGRLWTHVEENFNMRNK